eukprot:6659930-Pyramimonas_sp.AAC.1
MSLRTRVKVKNTRVQGGSGGGPKGVRRGWSGNGLRRGRDGSIGGLDLDLDLDWTGPGPELDWTAAYLGRGGEGQPLDGLPVALQPVGSAGHLVQPAGAERVPVREDGLVVDEPQDGVQARAVVVVRHAAAVVALAGGVLKRLEGDLQGCGC